MKKIVFFIAFLMAFVAVRGQNNSQQAIKLLKQTTEKIKLYKTISAKFDMTIENAEIDMSEKHSGTLLMKGDKYHVSMPDLGLKVYSDGKSVWNFMQTANQVTISKLGEEGVELFNPETIFSIYKEGYKANYIADKNERGKTFTHIELFPEDAINQVEFEKITVVVDKGNLLLERFMSHGKDGTNYGIEIKEFNSNIEINDKDFVFDAKKYKDVEILDLR